MNNLPSSLKLGQNFTASLSRSVRGPGLWILLLILTGTFLSSLIPPFQSPDEFDHIKRAYLLSKGVIVLESSGGNASGGMIDSGLSAYMHVYSILPFKPERKLSRDEIEAAKRITWTKVKEYSPAPGTGYYFPVIYAPQAIGLALGEKLGLTIDASYQLARMTALLASAILLLAAFNLYPASPLVIALLIIPMSLFQFSSASLDGVSTALAVYVIAAFLRIAAEKAKTSSWLFYTFTLSSVLLATSRVHLLPLLLLVLVASFYAGKRKYYFYIFVAALLSTLAWLAVAIRTTVDTRVVVGSPVSSVAWFYIKNPLAFFEVLAATLFGGGFIKFYRNSFFGILGWLDTPFHVRAYSFLLTCTVLIGLLSISFRNLKNEWLPRVALLLCAIVSVLLVFFALLISWNPHPAKLIQGVQGRYFLIPSIMMAYAVSGEQRTYEGFRRKVALALVILLAAFSIYGMPRLLIQRYYLADEQPEQVAHAIRASAPLEQNKPITLFMSRTYKTAKQPIKRIGIQLGTYGRKNSGRAELRVTSLDGRMLAIPFDLSELVDNQYKYFDLDAAHYDSGQIVHVTGGGISTWEARGEDGSVATCLLFEYPNGNKRYTRGCTKPM